MNDNEMNEPKGGILSDPMDRRSALKKAAAAGAIAWTAPMILSSTAHAVNVGNGVCTPKCAIPSFTATISARDACDGEEAAIQASIGTANKIAILVFDIAPTVPVTVCPCDANAPLVEVYLPPGTLFYKNNGKIGNQVQYDLNPPKCVPYVSSPSNNTSINYPGKPKEIVVFNSGGAMGDGWYTASGPICISVGCRDEVGGDMVYRKCNYNLCFNYTPSSSICTIAGPPLQSVFSQVGACTVGCDPCRPSTASTTTTTIAR